MSEIMEASNNNFNLFSIDYDTEPCIIEYKKLLTNKRQRFPQGFWSKDNIRYNSITLTKYLFTVVLGCKDKYDILKHARGSTFEQYYLGTMLHHYFNGSPYKALDLAYPYMLYPWEMNQFPHKVLNSKEVISSAMLMVIRRNPGIFDYTLEEKQEILKYSGLLESCSKFYDADVEKMLSECYSGILCKAVIQ